MRVRQLTHHQLRRSPALVTASAIAAALLAGATAIPGASAATAHAVAEGRGLFPGARLFVPPPSAGAPEQIASLLRQGDASDAALITKMESIPRAVWFTSGTPSQVFAQVRRTVNEARSEQAVPVLVAYDIPGRDCAQFSAGGALNQADYEAWINGFAQGMGSRRAVVILEPDALGNLPSNCGLSPTVYPFTNSERIAELAYAVNAFEQDPRAAVYLDGTHSAWQSVGTITQRLLAADVTDAQGFFLDVSNYQPTAELNDYGTWISDCIAVVTDPSNAFFGNPGACASQYFPATQSDFSTWGLTTQWYAQNMGNAIAATHFVIDSSRNGTGPNNMQAFANAPFDQPASVISTLASGNWCNPPNSGLGLRPTTDTGVPLLDAYLWVKTPGQSDGQCDAAGGVRAWDYSIYTQPSWPRATAAQAVFDPLWGMDDPAAGDWFGQQALQLAHDADPALLP